MMNENKFTPRAEEALRLSQESAEELGHGYVGAWVPALPEPRRRRG